MEYIKANFKGLLLIFLIISGIVVGLYLVSHPQIFKSRANAEAVNVVANDGSPVHVESNYQFSTQAENVTISIKDISKLK